MHVHVLCEQSYSIPAVYPSGRDRHEVQQVNVRQLYQARSQGGFGGFERTPLQGEKVQLCGSMVKVPATL